MIAERQRVMQKLKNLNKLPKIKVKGNKMHITEV